jgi:hypothetical protein
MLPLPVCMVVSAPRLDQQTGRRSSTMLRPVTARERERHRNKKL